MKKTVESTDFIQQVKYLTPKLYRKLDTIARTEVGSIIAVYAHDPYKPWGYVDVMADSVYNCPKHEMERDGRRFNVDDSVTHVNTDRKVIYMANYIKLGMEPTNVKRELNYNKIPSSKAYEFLLWHEIAHIKQGDTNLMFDVQCQGLLNEPEHQLGFAVMRKGQEIRADRWAWSKVFPTISMPKLPMKSDYFDHCLSVLEYYESTYRKFPVTIPSPISTNPDEYIYWKHAKDGIPWAGPAKVYARKQAGGAA